jgi:CheY-like chemotaxis protein
MEKQVILCVDDDRPLLDAIKSELQHSFSKTHTIEIANSGEEGLEVLEECRADNLEMPVIISDHLMPGMKGDEFLIEAHKKLPYAKKIMLTGQASSKAVGNAINKASLYRFLAKPWNSADLKLTVEQAIKSYTIEKEIYERVQLLNEANISLQLLSEQVHTASLVQKLLALILERLQASRVIFLLAARNAKHLFHCFELGNNITLRDYDIEIDTPHEAVPLKIIQFLQEHKQVFYLNKVRNNLEWKDYPYWAANKTKAFWAAPILKADKVEAILYAESDSIEFFITPLKESFLNLILPQVNIALDNCLLIENLEANIKARTKVVENQRDAIEDSIRYARRIQLALFPGEKALKKFFSDAYVFFHPQKMVSGNFYWLAENDNCLYVSVVDCTGMGLSGAFMAALNYSLLNEIFRQKPGASPAEILMNLHQRQLEQFKGEFSHIRNLQGTEIVITQFDLKQREAIYAGSSRKIYLMREGKVQVLATEPYKLGEGGVMPSIFKNYKLPILENDVFYLMTAGIENDLAINSDGVVDKEDSMSGFSFQQLENLSQQERQSFFQHLLDNYLQKNRDILNEDWLFIRIPF